MYRIYIDDITLFNSMFMKNVQVRNYDTRRKEHYHLPCFKTRLGKINLRCNGVIVWNSILTSGIPVDVSQAVSPKHWNVLSLKANYKESYSWKTPMSQISHNKVVMMHRNDSENLCIHIITALYHGRNLEMLLTETELSKIAFNLHPLLFHMK